MHYGDRVPKKPIPYETQGISNKWPQMEVTGKRVTPEQAFEIIRRTDEFLTKFDEYGGSNNRQMDRMIQRCVGLGPVMDLHYKLEAEWKKKQEALPKEERRGFFWSGGWTLGDLIRKCLGHIHTEYVGNRWAATCFAFGPDGWCAPDGTIRHEHNIGKWPSIDEVIFEWEDLGAAFPFLELSVTLWNCEACERDDGGPTPPVPTANFSLKNSEITYLDTNEGLHDQDLSDSTEVVAGDKLLHAFMNRSEHGLSMEFITAVGELQGPVVAKIVSIYEDLMNENSDEKAAEDWAYKCIEVMNNIDMNKAPGNAVINEQYITKDGIRAPFISGPEA